MTPTRGRARAYFDNAATSFPKPPAVYEAMDRFARLNGASPRGRFAEAREAGSLVLECRRRLCRFFGGDSPEHVVFTLNTTDALNLAIHGMVAHRRLTEPRRRIHLVTTWLDHNSVLRVFNALDHQHSIEQTRVRPAAGSDTITPDQIRAALTTDTLLVAINHTSNVTGAIQPIADIAAACRAAGVPLLVDAAQSLGHIPVNVESLGIDLLAFPGHKGLLGPTGTGGLYIRPGLEDRILPVRQGGTGSRSEEDVQPRLMPDRYEPGSHNTVGIVGLSEGVAYLLDRGIDSIRAHELELMRPLLEASVSGRFHGLRLLGPTDPADRVGVFSFVHESLPPQRIADMLDEQHGILTRAGLHCAPLAHRHEGTAPPDAAGAVRLSLGPFLTIADVEHACEALESVCSQSASTLANT